MGVLAIESVSWVVVYLTEVFSALPLLAAPPQHRRKGSTDERRQDHHRSRHGPYQQGPPFPCARRRAWRQAVGSAARQADEEAERPARLECLARRHFKGAAHHEGRVVGAERGQAEQLRGEQPRVRPVPPRDGAALRLPLLQVRLERGHERALGEAPPAADLRRERREATLVPALGRVGQPVLGAS